MDEDEKLNRKAFWYTVYTKPQKEGLSEFNINAQGIETYSPKIKTKKYKNGRYEDIIRPLFPCYIFARFDYETQYKGVKYARGVKKVITFGEHPIPLEDEIIESIKSHEQDGLVVVKREFKQGERVLIRDGPFRGFEAIFEKELSDGERVQILLDFLHTKAKLIFHKDSLEKFPK